MPQERRCKRIKWFSNTHTHTRARSAPAWLRMNGKVLSSNNLCVNAGHREPQIFSRQQKENVWILALFKWKHLFPSLPAIRVKNIPSHCNQTKSTIDISIYEHIYISFSNLIIIFSFFRRGLRKKKEEKREKPKWWGKWNEKKKQSFWIRNAWKSVSLKQIFT